ncbi:MULTISPECIES: ACT domain-containing protein [unclassified Flavobacterium]|uniref:ACT domain-containing protein n=1 Tax=unclassified Flavobacterium TaxID=196869 RepID=UPI0036176742
MSGEKNLATLLKTMKPQLNNGEYVFCTVKNDTLVNFSEILFHFKEEEGITIVLKKHIADQLSLNYSYIASWITLTVHSSLEAVGLTAAFSNALAKENISCNVVAAFYHDHIFVDKKDATKAMEILNRFSEDK